MVHRLGLQALSVQRWTDLQFGFTERKDLTKLHCVLLFNFSGDGESPKKVTGKTDYMVKKTAKKTFVTIVNYATEVSEFAF
ncbi:MAG: hypothetical protein LBT09_04320 [Planctomycetaceae bacterium]|jgi:hypothetical protein|nr:hypothetical protein [Planctomycetaceae bacterium]